MRARRFLLGAFGDPGHAFPMIALARGLAARGHEVTVQTWERWRAAIEAEGLRFAPAPEYHVFPTGPEPLDFYEAVVHATRDTLPLVAQLRPDAVVADILTLAPALSAELHGIPYATLIPHVNPHPPAGAPIYSIGARLPRTALGRAFWTHATRPVQNGLERGRREAQRRARGASACPPCPTSTTAPVANSRSSRPSPNSNTPASSHRRTPTSWVPCCGSRRPPRCSYPPGGRPLVLIAPSTSQDPEHRLLHAAPRGLADAPVRVLATWNRRLPPRSLPVPANTRIVDWVSYARTMPHCDLDRLPPPATGRSPRALVAAAAPCSGLPRRRGHERERRPRGSWAGAGVRLPRTLPSHPDPCACRRRARTGGALHSDARAGARSVGAGNDAPAHAAALLEELVQRAPSRLPAIGR